MHTPQSYAILFALLATFAKSAVAQYPVKQRDAALAHKARLEAEQEVKATIDSMLALLKSEDYHTLIARYFYPPDVDQTLSKVSFEALIAQFKMNAPALQAALQEVKGRSPEWNDEFSCAYFERKGRDVLFVRYKGYWYLRNAGRELAK
ncbi:MAG: hypothetical protein RMI34_13115 [Chloroherpetonaceae bacterium]|nr:hypothetical protein [Chloroherpetonaceae bacterium]MCS7212145.1 hypothetical protein [Chloroherpetonaceae bacterium]MDW8020998.1 hypothetical protein [Chloroherpetonaceae bacterium]MDW8465682.1 hypothetical protein [Chloroherpetonaceae bacterium]